MASLPAWIDERIDHGVEKKLTQRHVVETMLEAERPFYSAEQLRARVSPDVSKETVRLRLNELRELDVVATEAYPETITLYYVNHPESSWPLSPEGRAALSHESPLETLSVGEFVRLQNPAGIRTLVLAGFQLSLVLFAAGIVLPLVAAVPPVESTNAYWEAAGNLFVLCFALLFAERAARRLRSRGIRGTGVGIIPSTRADR